VCVLGLRGWGEGERGGREEEGRGEERRGEEDMEREANAAISAHEKCAERTPRDACPDFRQHWVYPH
jgi:hypothetical protein